METDNYHSALYYRYNEISKKIKLALSEGVLNLSELTWIYPSEVVILSNFIRLNPKIKVIPPKNKKVEDYINRVTGMLRNNQPKTSFPAISAKRLDNDYLDQMFKILEKFKYVKDSFKSSFMLIMSEMVENISSHSECSESIFTAQIFPRKGIMEMVFFDNGITIPKSLRMASKFTDTTPDEEIIFNALNGASATGEGCRYES